MIIGLKMVDDRSQMYRWPARVTSTADKLLELLENAPEYTPREPIIDLALIDRLIALTGHTPEAKPKPLNISFKAELSQRDYMRDVALKHRWDADASIAEYSVLDEKGEAPRESRTQDSYSYAKALWNDGLKKGWLRDTKHKSFKEDVQQIFDFLNKTRIRATYGAVAGSLAINTQMLNNHLGVPRTEAAWVVNKTTKLPTNYDKLGIPLPDGFEGSHVIVNSHALRKELDW